MAKVLTPEEKKNIKVVDQSKKLTPTKQELIAQYLRTYLNREPTQQEVENGQSDINILLYVMEQKSL